MKRSENVTTLEHLRSQLMELLLREVLVWLSPVRRRRSFASNPSGMVSIGVIVRHGRTVAVGLKQLVKDEHKRPKRKNVYQQVVKAERRKVHTIYFNSLRPGWLCLNVRKEY